MARVSRCSAHCFLLSAERICTSQEAAHVQGQPGPQNSASAPCATALQPLRCLVLMSSYVLKHSRSARGTGLGTSQDRSSGMSTRGLDLLSQDSGNHAGFFCCRIKDLVVKEIVPLRCNYCDGGYCYGPWSILVMVQGRSKQASASLTSCKATQKPSRPASHGHAAESRRLQNCRNGGMKIW